MTHNQFNLSGVQAHLSPSHSKALFADAIYQPNTIEGMQFPQTPKHFFKQLKKVDIAELSSSEIGRNRRYLQLQPGKLQGSLSEIYLDGVILIREQLSTEVQIEAAPPANFVPLATLFSSASAMRFCGKQFKDNSLLQATGSEWNLRTSESLDYIGSILDKTLLAKHTEILTGRPASPQWFISQASSVHPKALAYYKSGLNKVLLQLSKQPELLHNPDIRRLFSAQLFQLAIDLLSSTQQNQQPLTPYNRRLSGVRKVIDYLKVHASYLPTIPELCTVAQLRERSLEYGFKEQLGVTPVRYLKLVRLNGVKRDLKIANPATTRIVDIALRWGFVELGRFAGEYSRLFGELPSETLRRG